MSVLHILKTNPFNTLYYFSKPYRHTLHYVTVVMLPLQQFVEAPCRHSWQDIKVLRLDILQMHYASAKFHENSLTVSSKKFLVNYRVRLITCSSHGSGNMDVYIHMHTQMVIIIPDKYYLSPPATITTRVRAAHSPATVHTISEQRRSDNPYWSGKIMKMLIHTYVYVCEWK